MGLAQVLACGWAEDSAITMQATDINDVVEHFVLFLKRSGIPDKDLAMDIKFLEERMSGFDFARRYLLLPRHFGNLKAETKGLHAYMDMLITRRANHLRQVNGAAVALSSLNVFKKYAAVKMRVLQYILVPRRTTNFSTTVECMCTCAQCRFRCLGVVPFLDHVLALHM